MYTPTFKPDKFKALALHLAEYTTEYAMEHDIDCSLVRLSAMLYYCDFEMFRMSAGRKNLKNEDWTITGASYVKRQFGALPKELSEHIHLWETNGDIKIDKSKMFRYRLVNIIPTRESAWGIYSLASKGFTDTELKIIRDVSREVCALKRNDLIKMIQDEASWMMTDYDSVIPYSASLIAAPDSEDLILWEGSPKGLESIKKAIDQITDE